jgi:hypothetical protein
MRRTENQFFFLGRSFRSGTKIEQRGGESGAGKGGCEQAIRAATRPVFFYL